MTIPPIYTSEPMATRALAAEIRNDHARFVHLIKEKLGVDNLGDFVSVQCEASERVDLELHFVDPKSERSTVVGIEAKFDHQLTEEQVHRQLGVVDYLVVLLPNEESAPSWLASVDHQAVLTWAEALECFPESRLTTVDVLSMPLTRSRIEDHFRVLPIVVYPPAGWKIEVKRGGGGPPAIGLYSPDLPNGRCLRGQIQVAGRKIPNDITKLKLEYSIGISVNDSAEEYPDPDAAHAAPGWVDSLVALYDEILKGEEDRLLVSTRSPGQGGGDFGKNKVRLAKKHLPQAPWLAKGYANWALGIKSTKVGLDQLGALASLTMSIMLKWFEVEKQRQAP